MITETSFDTEKILNDIVLLISKNTGINFRGTYKNCILRYIEKRKAELKISYQEYILLLKNNEQEIFSLINASTVNETYFFREENQYSLVKKLIFQKQNIDIWSAACSSGEEIYSLKLLCDSMNVRASFFASDINTDKLEFLKEGIYSKHQATRELDGKIFHNLLFHYLRDDKISFSSQIRNSIECKRINLIDFDSYKVLGSKKFDIVFLRNVFIYFSLEERYKILNNIAEKYLKPDGYIFLSLSETAQIEEKFLLADLEKKCIDDVFIFHKKSSQKKEVQYE